MDVSSCMKLRTLVLLPRRRRVINIFTRGIVLLLRDELIILNKLFIVHLLSMILINMKVCSVSPYKIKQCSSINPVTFKAMKPSMFTGIDYACVRRFKAPVEKFNTIFDLQNWASGKVHFLLTKDFQGRKEATQLQRKSMIAEWGRYLTAENSSVTPAISLIVLSSILKELKANNDNIPPVLNKRALADSLSDLDRLLKADKEFQFDFNKIYQVNVNKVYNDKSTNISGTMWVVIPSESNDRENFAANVEKLKFLSASSWCTKSFNAEPYLSQGDFHIYLEQGKPRLGLRFNQDTLVEIQNERNNNIISLKLFDVLNDYIENKEFNLSGMIISRINKAREKKIKSKEIREKIGIDAINNNNVYTIMQYLDFAPETKSDGSLSIREYKVPDLPAGLTLEDLGINENKLFKEISEIRNDAVFRDTDVTDLGKLMRIGGYVDFENSFVMSLGCLEEVGGYANFASSLVNSTGKLKRIGKWADFENSILEELKNIQYIGGNVYFNNSRIKKLGELKYIGGSADFSNSEIASTEQLKYIGKKVKYDNSLLSYSDFKEINKTRDF